MSSLQSIFDFCNAWTRSNLFWLKPASSIIFFTNNAKLIKIKCLTVYFLLGLRYVINMTVVGNFETLKVLLKNLRLVQVIRLFYSIRLVSWEVLLVTRLWNLIVVVFVVFFRILRFLTARTQHLRLPSERFYQSSSQVRKGVVSICIPVNKSIELRILIFQFYSPSLINFFIWLSRFVILSRFFLFFIFIDFSYNFELLKVNFSFLGRILKL